MRYVITGGSGYIGSRLVDHLSRRQDVERIEICDLQPPRHYKPKTGFTRLDVRDRAAAWEVLERADACDVLLPAWKGLVDGGGLVQDRLVVRERVELGALGTAVARCHL